MYSWNFQLVPVFISLLGADFLQHYNLQVNIKGQQVVHTDCLESIIIRASPDPVPAFQCASFFSTPQCARKLLTEFPNVLSSDGFTALEPCHGVRHHLLINLGPLVYEKPWRLDPEKLAAAKAKFSAMEKGGIIRRLSLVFSSSYGQEEGWRMEALWRL